MLLQHLLYLVTEPLDVAFQEFKRFVGIGQGVFIAGHLQFFDQERDGIDGRPQIVGDEGKMFFLTRFEIARLLRGKGRDCCPHTVIDPMADNARGLPDEVKAMMIRHGEKGVAQEIVFRHHLSNVQAIVNALHSVARMTAARFFLRGGVLAPMREIPDDFIHYIRHMIG